MNDTALLISVRPRFAEMIFEGTKSVELRRLRPQVEDGGLVFVYVSSPEMALGGAFEAGGVVSGRPGEIWRRYNGGSGLSKREFNEYFKGAETAFAILIRRRWKVPTPVQLSQLRKEQEGFHPPQSYHYVCCRTYARLAGLRLPR